MESHLYFLQAALDAKVLFASITPKTTMQQNDISQARTSTHRIGICGSLQKHPGLLYSWLDLMIIVYRLIILQLLLEISLPAIQLVQLKDVGHHTQVYS